jgi:hypothetical protein
MLAFLDTYLAEDIAVDFVVTDTVDLLDMYNAVTRTRTTVLSINQQPFPVVFLGILDGVRSLFRSLFALFNLAIDLAPKTEKQVVG